MRKNALPLPAQNDLTPKQREVLEMFDGEALTASDVALNMQRDVLSVRAHIRALVAGRHIESSKRGRVVYYHKTGVPVPNGEKRSDDAFDENENKPRDEDGVDDERTEQEGTEEQVDALDDDEESDGEIAFERGMSQRRTAPKDDEFLIEGTISVERAQSILNVQQFERERLWELRRTTPAHMLPIIKHSLEIILALRNNAQALEDAYNKIQRQEGIDKRTLIAWATALASNNVTVDDIMETATPTPHPAASDHVAESAAYAEEDVEDPMNEESVENDPSPPPPEPPQRKRAYTHQQSTNATALSMRSSEESNARTKRSIHIDPRLTPKQQMDRDVFQKDPALLALHETNLCAALTDLEGRLSHNEWSEYALILSPPNDAKRESMERFITLFRKAHPSIPAMEAHELATLILSEEDMRTGDAAARYAELSDAFLRTA